MKNQNDILETKCWLYKIVTDPYQIFAESFTHAGVAHFRHVIKKLLYYAEADKLYQEKPPCDVLLYMKIIRSQIRSAYILKEKKSPIVVPEEGTVQKKYYCSHYQPLDEWSEFPRFLSRKEFCKPYLVFKQFFKYRPLKKWVEDIEEITDCALSRFRGELHPDMLNIYTHLAKLVESAHLINVREVTHVGGHLKNRFSA